MKAEPTAQRPPIRRRRLPAAVRPRWRASAVVERNLFVYRRAWWVLFSGFLEPVLYLFAMGVGLGGLVGDVPGPRGPIDYTVYIAPGLLAASAMNGALLELTFNVYHKIKWAKTYEAMLATPLSPADIVAGELFWSQLRGLLYSAAFLVVMAVMGLASPWAVLALPAAVLLGCAFAAVGLTATTFIRSWQDFDLIQLVILPLFLFSTTFFPPEIYPPFARPLLQLSPLYHGASSCAR